MARTSPIQEYRKEAGRILLHRWSIGDVEDPELAAMMFLDRFRESEKGSWIFEHTDTKSLMIHSHPNIENMCHEYAVTGKLLDPCMETVFYLRWPMGK
jgi:hypothetical protein